MASRTAGAMRSGRLWSSAGRQRTSKALQPLARRSAAISRASAPQAMMSVTGRAFTCQPSWESSGGACGARAASGAARGDERLGGLDRDGGVAAVRIGPNRLAELLVERCTAHQHDVVLANADFLRLVDDDFHVGHGGGEQRRHPEDVRLVLIEGRQVFLNWVVDAEIDHL